MREPIPWRRVTPLSEIILHHYSESPFAEKIRAILGFKRLNYRSVLVPMMLPKPDVIALTGGYRRTPILQIGSDIYCDTALVHPARNRGGRVPVNLSLRGAMDASHCGDRSRDGNAAQ